MKKIYVLVLLLPLMVIGWRAFEPAAAAAPKAQMNMGPEKKQSMAFSVYRWGDSDTYAGWQGVENSALALVEMAPILLTPRACSNGLPAPVAQPDWKKAVEGLVDAGEKAHKAAQTRNMDAMLDVGETLSSACAACHDKYRDVDLSGGTRCKVGK